LFSNSFYSDFDFLSIKDLIENHKMALSSNLKRATYTSFLALFRIGAYLATFGTIFSLKI